MLHGALCAIFEKRRARFERNVIDVLETIAGKLVKKHINKQDDDSQIYIMVSYGFCFSRSKYPRYATNVRL